MASSRRVVTMGLVGVLVSSALATGCASQSKQGPAPVVSQAAPPAPAAAPAPAPSTPAARTKAPPAARVTASPSGAQAKDIFYKPPQPTAVVTQLALNYRILLNRGGVVQQVPQNTAFRAGDQLRLLFRSSINGHLYIFNKGTTGAGRMLFPDPRINGGNNLVTRHAEYTIPPVGSFIMDQVPGVEELIVILSPRPLVRITFQPGAPIPAPAWQQVMVPYLAMRKKSVADKTTKDITFVDEGQQVAAPPAPQVFVATQIAPVAVPQGMLVHTIRLLHQ